MSTLSVTSPGNNCSRILVGLSRGGPSHQLAARSLRRPRVPVLLRRRQADAARHGRGEDVVRQASDDLATTGLRRPQSRPSSSRHRRPRRHRIWSPRRRAYRIGLSRRRHISHPSRHRVWRPGRRQSGSPLPLSPRRLAIECGSDVAAGSTVHAAEADTVQPPSVAPRRARKAVPAVTDFADCSRPRVDGGSPEPLSRPRKIAYIVVCAVLALSVLGLAYVHLRPTGSGHPAHSAASTTTSSSTRTTTTTTVVLPTTLQPGAEAAATALVSSWSTGNKAVALTVATPTAVADLFAAPYTSGLAIDRGCSTTFMPIVCTFGPPGGASPTDPIYEIDVSKTAGGWYVSSVKIEN